MRVRAIVTNLQEKRRTDDRLGPSEDRRRDQEDIIDKQRASDRPRERKPDFDNISAEEAKERLLREYEKRGVSRDEARKALINELVK